MSELRRTWLDTDEWESLKTYTDARIALGKTGVSVPMRESLAFKLAHAHAKDAVYSALYTDSLMQALAGLGLEALPLHSQAQNRDQYLQRPDYGRRLSAESAEQLKKRTAPVTDLSIILADGLSAEAINQNAIPVMEHLKPALLKARFTLAPVALVEQGRVAIADEIGSLLNARMTIIFIGERPGLSSADSMGAYLTFAPKIGLTDERRNCISNIRPQGLSAAHAVDKIMYLVQEAFRLQLSGVSLKDKDDTPQVLQ